MQENVNIPDSTITTKLSFRRLVLMNMQQLTNFPYIEKDFDALTDYELLCLVVKFLNDVIANQNEQNASITRMYQSFLALQDYVNNTKDDLVDAFNNLDDYVRNYFDNLDVQEEINNKLDQMLEDGVLEQIIEQFLQLTSLICFDNVANMKSSVNLANGSFAKTLGYYNKNDGGGATYKIRTITNQDIIDEMFIISIGENNLIAELILDEPKKINVLQVGTKRNIDEDQSTKVQSLFNLNSKYTIYFPSGRYYFESGLINNHRHDIIGDVNTVTDYDRDINGTRFYFTNLENDTILLDCSSGSRCSIRNIYIVCDNVEITQDRSLISDGTTPVDIFSKTTKNTGIVGLKFGNFGNQAINVSIYGCNTGLILNTYNTIENVGILSCEIGIETKNDNQMSNLNIQKCEKGIILKGALNNLTQIRMDSIRYYGLVIESSSTSNNISNFIADICQYGAIEMSGTYNNYITGQIGRSGTYYANFIPSNVTEPEKACRIYLHHGCKNNKIDIIASRDNTTDTSSITKYAPVFTFVFGVNGSNNKYNDLSIAGQPLATEITPNNVLTIEQLNQIIKFTGQLSGSLNFQGKTYSFNNVNVEFTQYNVYVIKPIRYDSDYATLNNGNLNMSSNSITNVGELRFGNSTDGWVTLSKTSAQGNLKVQNMDTSYVRTDAQITGVASPTTSTSAANKAYVDNH